MKKVYIAGPISDDDKKQVAKNLERFFAKEKEMKETGVNCFNPASIKIPHGKWVQYTARGIMELLTCDIIYLMKGWKRSLGASQEYEIAKLRGLEIIEEA